MSVKILIPTALRRYAGDQESVQVEGQRVGNALQNLADACPELKPHLFTDENILRNFVNVYVNEEDIRYLNKEETELQDGDEITIVPAVAGGQEVLTSQAPSPGTTPAASSEAELSKEEIERYSRHLIIPEVGVGGQKKLKQAKMLCVGTGGLGSPVAMYLAAAGVGTIGLVDFDVVDYTNLQRQIIHGTKDVGKPKLESAKESIEDINPHIDIQLHNAMLSSDNALEIMEPYDLVIDGTDNFPTRYLVNDACVLLGKPNVYGSIFRFEGQASIFWAEKGPCYRCLYPEPPPPGMVPSCAEGGVLGILPGIIGVIQANEAVKLIMEKGKLLIGRLLLYDALDMKFREMRLQKDPACPLCGENPTVTELIDYEHFCGIGTAEDRIILDHGATISATGLVEQLDRGDEIYLLDVREPHEYEICKLDDAHLIPLGEIEKRISELDRSHRIVAYCRCGQRSAQAVKFLQEAGFKKVQNLTGGILAWSNEVDPSMPKY